jgi:prepilin peptidase CpaA
MAIDPNLLPLAGFTAVMIAAAVVDVRRLVIPNGLVLALCVLWLLQIESTRGVTLVAALEAAACAALALAGGALLFARGLIGGGDVKLFAAATLWAGAGALPRLLALTALIGGGLALLFLSPLGPRLTAVRRADPAPAGSGALRVGRTPIPYGVAISAAALIVAIPPCLD